jgi:GNAT superfamily N-acetyltransferase
MAVTIICKQVRNLTEEELEQCRRLTLGDNGTMRDDLMALHEFEPELPLNTSSSHTRRVYAQALLARDEAAHEIRGWCLVDTDGDTQLYVHEQHRRQGLGTRLMRKLFTLHSKVSVAPWDAATSSFFSRFSEQPNIELNMRLSYLPTELRPS